MLITHIYEYDGGDLSCILEYTPGEPAITTGPSDGWHPGSKPYAVLLKAHAGGVDVTEILDPGHVKSIESQACAKADESYQEDRP